MDNVPVSANGSAASHRSGEARHHAPSYKKGSKKPGLKFVAKITGIVLLVAALTFGVLFLYKSSTVANIDSNKYQAVFFTNGQVVGFNQVLKGLVVKHGATPRGSCCERLVVDA